MFNVTKEQQLILLGLVLVLVVGGGVTLYRQYFNASLEAQNIPLATALPAVGPAVGGEREIMVYLCGEVKKEGVYRLKEGARLADLVQLAGGFTGWAEISGLNLAEFLKDGQKIIIGRRRIEGAARENTATKDGRININSASLDQLQTLSGVGPTTAQKIIGYRKAHGPFSKPDDLLKIPRFGKARLEQIKDYISIY